MNKTFQQSVLEKIRQSPPRFAGAHGPDAATEHAAAEARARVMAEIKRLKLDEYVRQLDSDGYTVVPPEVAAPTGLAERIRDSILREAAKGENSSAPMKPDEINEASTSFGQVQFTLGLLGRGVEFEQAVMNEASLALATYLLGESCVLQEFLGFVKGPGTEYMPLHTDQNQNGTPAPFPAMAQVVNVTWALTDYTEDNGSTCFVAGSHKFCRHPTYKESTDLSLFKPVTAKAGSIIIWHGNTWHGSVPRINPGLRVNLVTQFARWYHRVRESFHEMLPPEAAQRHPPRFGILTGATQLIAGTESTRVANISHFG